MIQRLFFLLFFTYLSSSSLLAQPSKKWQKRLNGEWTSTDGFTLSFWNDEANYQTRYGYQPYQLIKDTLILKPNLQDLPQWNSNIKLLLLDRWNLDSMRVQIVEHPYEAKGLVKMLYHHNNLDYSLNKWDSLTYTSHPCFGNCENYKLKFWPNGKVEYWGIYRANPLGYFSFQLKKEELKKLNQLLRSSNFQKQPAIWDLPQDLYAQTVEFYGTNGKVLRAHADNFSPEFNWLCAYLRILKKEKSRFFFKDE